jgi:hypothetical protein
MQFQCESVFNLHRFHSLIMRIMVCVCFLWGVFTPHHTPLLPELLNESGHFLLNKSKRTHCYSTHTRLILSVHIRHSWPEATQSPVAFAFRKATRRMHSVSSTIKSTVRTILQRCKTQICETSWTLLQRGMWGVRTDGRAKENPKWAYNRCGR